MTGRRSPSKQRMYLNIITAALTLFFLPGCSDSNKVESDDQGQIVIRVDHHVLTLEEFNHDFEPLKMNYPDADPAGLRDARIRYLLQRLEEILILRRAEELDIHVPTAELDAAVDDVKKDYPENGFQEMLMTQAVSLKAWEQRLERQLLVQKVIRRELEEKVAVSPEEISQFYDEHRDEWRRVDQVRARQVLLPSEEQAVAVRNQIEDGQDFAELARQHSTAPEAERGGDMGFVERGHLPEELEAPIFALKKGELSPVVKTSYGYHIFEVVEKRQAGKPEMNDLIGEIRELLKREKVGKAYGPWLAELRARYAVVVNDQII